MSAYQEPNKRVAPTGMRARLLLARASAPAAHAQVVRRPVNETMAFLLTVGDRD